MNTAALLFLLVNALALLALPRRWAPLPLLLGACYMTLGQGIEMGPFSFPVIRLLIAAGVLRVFLRGERPAGGLNSLDKVLLVWGAWCLGSSLFHRSPGDALVFRLGLAYNTLGIYFLMRCFCASIADLAHLAKVTGIVLVPLALEMLQEHATGRNLFAILGAVPEEVTVRNDKLRAQGPFAHAILAGTVGAVCFPLMIGIWRRYPLAARLGAAACLTMILTCNSSGPMLAALAAFLGLALWRWRHLTRQMRIAAVIGYVLLDLVMKAPAYYLIARIDLTGGSTGWHRAHLIESSIKHLPEWWLAGTDYTRHWMPTGVSWSPEHADITNHYISMGVIGGLPLMGLFIAALWVGFVYVGRILRVIAVSGRHDGFFVWSLGAGLFAHAATCVSVSYFDQSFVFLCMNLAVIGSLYNVHAVEKSRAVAWSFEAGPGQAGIPSEAEPAPLASGATGNGL